MKLINAFALLIFLESALATDVPDFSENPCKNGMTEAECLNATVTNSALLCEMYARISFMEGELGEKSLSHIYQGIHECASRATKVVSKNARTVLELFSKNKEVINAVKELRVAHKLFVQGLAPESEETEAAYYSRISRLNESMDAKKTFFELSAE